MANTTDDMIQLAKATDIATDSQTEFTDAQTKGNEVQQKAKEYLKETIEFTKSAGQALQNITAQLVNVSRSQKDTTILTKQLTTEMGLLTGAVFGATKAFDGFGNISGVNTFTGSLDKAVSMAKGLGSGAMTALQGIAKIVGVDPRVATSIEGLATKILTVGHRMAEVADVGLKLQTGFLQMSAAGGNFGRVFEQSGPHLGNLNNLLQQQIKLIVSSSSATNTSTEETVKYYNELGKIPGYLTENIRNIDSAGHSINMLTAAIKLANGTGQTQEAILNDLKTAYVAYGEGGEKALEFTARIADLSQKYNIQIEDTRSFMTDMANSFKFLGDNAQGTADVFERFFQNLKDTGLSARASRDVVEDFTKSIGNLTIAQKAFLSARTGGPGGLMGAVQIEEEIRKGNIDQVRKRVEQALKQQFGRIVTQEEGAKSERGAQEFIRQRMFLQQGPFGQIFGQGAEGEGKATRFLEALAKPGGVGGRDVATEALRKDIQRGTDVSNKSLTPLTKAVAELEGIRMMSGVIALNTAQKAFGVDTKNEDLRRKLLGGIVDAMKAGTQAADQAKKTQQQDTSALDMTRSYKNLMNSAEMFHNAASSGLNVMKTITKFGDETAAPQTKNIQVQAQHQHETVKATQTPQNIVVHVNSVCPDCHKKFVSATQKSAISNAPDLGPGF